MLKTAEKYANAIRTLDGMPKGEKFPVTAFWVARVPISDYSPSMEEKNSLVARGIKAVYRVNGLVPAGKEYPGIFDWEQTVWCGTFEEEKEADVYARELKAKYLGKTA